MPLVKLSLWLEPVDIPASEIPILQGQGLYQYTAGGPDDPSKNGAPAKGATAAKKE